MTIRRSIFFSRAAAAIACAFLIAVAIGQPAPPCIRSISASQCNGQTVSVPMTVQVVSAVSAALGTPGIQPAANTGCINTVAVTLCSGKVVNVVLTPAVVAAVGAAIPAPVTQPATQPVTQPLTEPTTNPVTQPVTQPVTEPATQPTTNPQPPAPPFPTEPPTPAQTNSYTVAASEILKLTSTVSVDGIFQPRLWKFQGEAKEGFNANFWLPSTTAAGTYPLVESDVSGGNAVTRDVIVQADPYHVVSVPAGANLTPLITGAPDLTRYLLAPDADYAITAQPYVSQRLQIVGQAGTTITCKPVIADSATDWNALYAFWTTTPTAKLGVLSVGFSANTGGKFNSQGKTGTGAVYCSIGSAWTVDCTFNGVDLGMMADSTPTHQADGILVQGCTAPLVYGQMVWMNGLHGDVDTCSGHSLLEHPIRASIVDLNTNQVPQFWRLFGCKFDATHQHASTADPGKESAALRDGKYFFVQSNKFVGWGECGQATVSAWDYWGQYVFDANTFLDPTTAPKTGTLNVRAGTNGPGSITNNACAVPMVITAHVPPAMSGNSP